MVNNSVVPKANHSVAPKVATIGTHTLVGDIVVLLQFSSHPKVDT